MYMRSIDLSFWFAVIFLLLNCLQTRTLRRNQEKFETGL